MLNLVKFVLIATLLVGLGCSAESASERAAADARAKAADARVAIDAVSPPEAHLVIPSGTLLRVSLIDPIGSDTNSAGDLFMASLAESLVINGATVFTKGTKVLGRVVGVDESGRVKGRASIRLVLTDIAQGKRMVGITTGTITATAESSTTRDAKIIAGVGGVGTVIGAIAGGKKGAGIGAATGVGTGTGVVLSTKGKEIHYGPETRLNFTLTHSVEL